MKTSPIRNIVRYASLRTGFGAALCFALAAISLHAARKEDYAGESAKWRRYESPNFELFSANPDAGSRDLLHNLELFRALFFDTFKLKERQPLEVTVYYFKDKDDFFKYVSAPQRQNDNLAGFYMNQADRGTIVVSPSWDDETARSLIFHEYIHHLMRVSGENPPLWYNEGVAELYSSVEISSAKLELGKPLPWHINTLRQEKLLPLEVLFSVDHTSPIYNTGKHTGQFYAESWALLHYWYYGNSKLNHEKISIFMNHIRNEQPGADPVFRRKLFQQTMGMDYADMEYLLREYVRSGSYGWRKTPVPDIAGAKTYVSREMPAAEIRERLTELDLRVNQSGRSRLAFLRLTEQPSVTARTFEVLGTDALMQGEPEMARTRWQKAFEMGSNNPAIYHELGLMEGRRWFTNFNYYFRLPDERAQQLRILLKRSIERAPEQSDAYEMLAWVEATASKPNITNVNLIQGRYPTLIQKGRTMLALALVRIHLNDPKSALKMLDQVEAMKPVGAAADYVRQIRAKLQSTTIAETDQPVVEATELVADALPVGAEKQADQNQASCLA